MTRLEMVLRWGEQALKDKLGWVRDVKGATSRETEAYEAGFRAGWGDAVNTLSLHNYADLKKSA